MLINNEIKNNANVSTTSNDFNNVFLDLDKHYPLFKIFDITNLVSKQFDKYTLDNFYITFTRHFNRKWIEPKDYNKEVLNIFLNNYRTTNLIKYKSNTSKSSFISKKLINWCSLNHIDYYGINIIYSTYTLGLNDKLLYCLCIKPEYIYYVKLCYLAEKEIEFDCFYLLVRKDGNYSVNSIGARKLYNIINKAIKHFGTDVIIVDSIEKEISKTVSLPKFNTMKDYNNWLTNIKNNFLNYFKNNNFTDSI
jgi:hypothetical protein